MPTPSNNQPTSIAEVVSTRTCPPDLDRISAWRDFPEPTGSLSDPLDELLSPPSGTAPEVLSRSDDGNALLAPEALKVEQNLAAGTDLDLDRDRSVSPTESCSHGRSSPVMPTPSLMRYEFSNVRVRTALLSSEITFSIDHRVSYCQTTLLRSFVPEVDSRVLKCLTNKSITWMWRSNMWT